MNNEHTYMDGMRRRRANRPDRQLTRADKSNIEQTERHVWRKYVFVFQVGCILFDVNPDPTKNFMWIVDFHAIKNTKIVRSPNGLYSKPG